MGHDFRIKQLKETRLIKTVTAVHVFFDLRGVPIEEKKGGTITPKEAFDFIFSYTDWDYELADRDILSISTFPTFPQQTVWGEERDFNPELVPNFGDDNALALIHQACQAFDLDFKIMPNKRLLIGKDLGNDDDFQFRYKKNIKSLNRNVDSTDFGTRIVGRGAEGLKVEYISPLEEEYRKNNPDFKPIYAEEVKDDRITKEETMIKKLKRTLKDKPEINLELETVVLGDDRNVFDYVWLIYEPLGITIRTQVIKKTEYPHAPHKNKVELGDKKKSFTDLMTEQNIKIDQNNKEVHSRIDQTNDRISLEVETIDEKISSLVVEQDRITLRVENFEKETSAQFEVLEDEISSRVTSEEAESIFEQKADSFTFSASQINFDGEVFGNYSARFEGQVRAERLIGTEISGVTLKTSSSTREFVHMENQVITLRDDYLDKLIIGFRDEYNNPTGKPYIVWGHGKSDGTSVMTMEKGEEHFYMRYSSQRGTTGIEMNYSGSVSLISEYTLHLKSRNSIEADNKIYAPDFVKTSTVKVKDNIKKFDDDALGIVMDHDVFTYHFIHDLEKGIYDNEQIGFLAEAAPMLKNGEGISESRVSSISWKAIQDLKKESDSKFNSIEKRLSDVETLLEVMI